MAQNSYLASKPRYETLDGLRGVAAVIVVAFHLFETYSGGPVHQIINHGYLAVDFFFALSGFVIGYAYDDRWNRMSLGNFFKRRLIRLHPLVVLACVFGMLMYYFTASPAFPMVSGMPVWRLLLIFLLGCTMFPALTSWDIRGWQETNPLVGPTWTLFFEYIANILYALVIRRFSTKLLSAFVVVFALLTVNLTLNVDLFNLWQDRGEATYTVIGGWAVLPDQMLIGFTRLLYPFFMGLLLARIGVARLSGKFRIRSVNGGFWICSAIIAVVLCMPRLGGASQPWLNGLYESLVILLVFPLVVSLGACSSVAGRRSVEWCKFLGHISYPLYIMHFPLVYLQIAWVSAHPDATFSQNVFVSVAAFVMALALSYGALKLYDLPLRAWLKKKYLMR